MTRTRLALFAASLSIVAAAGWYTLTRGSVRRLERATWPVQPTTDASPMVLADVLARGTRVELDSLDTGAVHVARRRMLAHPGDYREEPAPLRVFAHLVRHPQRGDFLIDSGLPAEFAGDRYGNIARPARWLIALLLDAPYSQEPGQDVFTQLAARGAHPRAVFFTHLHMDHTAGVPGLPAGVELVTGPHEADDPPQIFGFGHFTGRSRIEELDFSRARELPPLGPALDLFGDGSLLAIATPGHSRGHVSFLVNSTRGPVLLVGDASHFNWAFAHGAGPAGTDEPAGQVTLDRLRAFAAAHPEVTIFCGHEAPAPVSP